MQEKFKNMGKMWKNSEDNKNNTYTYKQKNRNNARVVSMQKNDNKLQKKLFLKICKKILKIAEKFKECRKIKKNWRNERNCKKIKEIHTKVMKNSQK